MGRRVLLILANHHFSMRYRCVIRLISKKNDMLWEDGALSIRCDELHNNPGGRYAVAWPTEFPNRQAGASWE